MDDTSAGGPKLNTVLLRRALQEIENLRVVRNRLRQIRICTSFTDDEMVAVYTSRHRGGRQSAAHELQKSHLRTGILHGHAIRLQLQVRLSADIPSIVRVGQKRLLRRIQMRVQDLLGECELARGTKDAADFAEAAQQLFVRRRSRGDVDVARIRYGGRGREASCLGGKTRGEEVRLFKSVFNAIISI